MPTWSPDQYLRFGDLRTQACRDLVGRVAIASPRVIVDLGCGPGNSTEVLAERWPDAAITGLDSSVAMIEAARRAHPQGQWKVGDIAAWDADDEGPFDVVFSNAALQWVDDHAALYPRLLGRAGPGGALAVQVPANYDGLAHRLMRELAASAAWRAQLPADGVREWHVHEPEFYYDVLAPHAARVDVWTTEYMHIMAGPEAIVEWYKGTGLRPYLDALGSDAARQAFTEDYLSLIQTAFPRHPDGKVIFPFQRLFVVAYRLSS